MEDQEILQVGNEQHLLILHLVYLPMIQDHLDRFCSAVQRCPPRTENNRSPKQALVFTCLLYKSCENTAGKEEIARNQQFLLFPQCFLPIQIDFCKFHQI